jgi:hypothetical protein
MTVVKKHTELGMLWGCLTFAGCFVLFTCVWTAFKREVIIDRRTKTTCDDWEKERTSYWKWAGRWDNHYRDVRVPPITQVLLDEMLEAAKARGTR